MMCGLVLKDTFLLLLRFCTLGSAVLFSCTLGVSASFVVGEGIVVFFCSIPAICSNAFWVGSPASNDTDVVDGGVCRMEIISPAACCKKSFNDTSGTWIVCGIISTLGTSLVCGVFGK